MKKLLTKENPISSTFSFEGVINLLIVGGSGSLYIERSVGGSDFYPLSTNIAGGVAVFPLDGSCAYNGTLEEKGLQTSYRLRAELDSGEVEYVITRAK